MSADGDRPDRYGVLGALICLAGIHLAVAVAWHRASADDRINDKVELDSGVDSRF